MKFMLMMMTDENAERSLTPRERDGILARHTTVGDELRAAGKWVDGAACRSGTTR